MQSYNLESFRKDLKTFHITLSEVQEEQFIKYYELLIQWNEKVNLTTITDFDEVIKKHYVDSLSLLYACPQIMEEDKSLSLIDVGTGAGFPGIPLKIVFPHLQITLLDSLKKRTLFLDEVIRKLDLKNMKSLHGRAEDYASPAAKLSDGNQSLREKYDICVSRAVANLSTLSEYCLPFVKKGGVFVSYKSEKIEMEVEAAKKCFYLMGGKLIDHKEFILPESDIPRSLYVIKKELSTPKKYPRKAGLPSKEPIQ